MSSATPSPIERQAASDVVITHPNRDKPVVQATRATVVLLLLVSAALVLIITVAGYLAFAFYATRWNRGVLPVAAVLAVILGIFALLAGPAWFDRDKSGFAAPDYLSAGLLGVLTLLILPVQILLVTFAMRGFSQGWNVELERRDPAAGTGLRAEHTDAPPQPA